MFQYSCNKICCCFNGTVLLDPPCYLIFTISQGSCLSDQEDNTVINCTLSTDNIMLCLHANFMKFVTSLCKKIFNKIVNNALKF